MSRRLPSALLPLLCALLVPAAQAQTIGSGGITNTDTSTYTITSNVTLGANQTWDAQAGDIDVSGNLNGNWRALTVTGAHDTTLSGDISNLAWSNGLTKTGTGTLTLSGNNSFGGPVSLQDGTTLLASNTALGASTWNNTVLANATLALSNNITVTEGSFNIAGQLLNVSGDNTLNASLTLTGNTTFTSQQDSLTLSQTVTQGDYDLTLAGPGDWNVSGQVNANSTGTLSLTASGQTTISGNLNVGGGLLIDNTGTTAISSNLNLGNGALTIQGDSNATLTGGQVNAAGGLTIGGNATVDIANTLNLSGADITLTSTGDINLSGAQINVGDILLSGDGATTFGTQINADSFVQTGTGTTIFNGTGDNYFGSVSLEGGTVIAEQNGIAFNTTNLNLDGVDLQFGEDLQIPEWTTVTLTDDVNLLLNGSTQVWDELIITGNSVIDFGGGNANLSIGSITIDEGASLTIMNWSEENLDVFNASIDPDSATSEISFTGGGSASWDPISGNITPMTPVPEPRTYGLLFMATALLGYTLRRKYRSA
ncbi:beta strand repeat-containing protein [Actomonas aquatica]|uniref:Autotransporter-associated beta strand repeat-containing protein n=1 Tax=Actomonas aquatica TaxID=2866162 RepID=A0ABZ1C484_9BACT|nr:autotransporter-associated beta strand repeat-containing protein [Opitutus sp. WL0086]WRQ86359.1 autotransporter-associated beta strand repeat-containing protein [Opitutus sp. WL0086]